MALPVNVGRQAFQRLQGVVGDAENSIQAPPTEQIAALNKIAATQLF